MVMRDLKKLKNLYSGDMCVIIGNGPSLTVELVKKVRQSGVYSFVVNGFCIMFDEIEYQPYALCMSDFGAIKKYAQRYPPETLNFLKSGWRKKIDFDLKNVYELPFDCEHHLYTHNGLSIKDGYFTLDPGKENFCGDTVLLDFAIPVAFYMGFKEMYLIGIDCDYSKGYFSDKYTTSTIPKSFKRMINNDYSIIIPSYRYIKDFLKQNGCKLYKITESKYLDFIETRSVEQAFGKKTT